MHVVAVRLRPRPCGPRSVARGLALAAGLLACAGTLGACGLQGVSVGEGLGADGSADGGSSTGGSSTGDSSTGGSSTGGSSTGGSSTGGSTGTVCTTDTYANYAGAFFSTKCQGCHSGTNPPLGTYAQVSSAATSANSDIGSGRMPLGSTLSADDKARIQKWFACKLPQ